MPEAQRGADAAVDWAEGTWLNPPAHVERDGDVLVVSATQGSDFWRTTSYGFIHDDGHALLRPFETGSAVEVSFRVELDAQFDQAGVLVRAAPEHWLKAGVERADGVAQLGAVVTHELSDWSAGPVPGWEGHIATIRVSRAGDALTVRARREGEDWRFVRLAPWPAELPAMAGPFCCAPTRPGLRVRFTAWRVGAADERLHE